MKVTIDLDRCSKRYACLPCLHQFRTRVARRPVGMPALARFEYEIPGAIFTGQGVRRGMQGDEPEARGVCLG